jgi:hypothetical protein
LDATLSMPVTSFWPGKTILNLEPMIIRVFDSLIGTPGYPVNFDNFDLLWD